MIKDRLKRYGAHIGDGFDDCAGEDAAALEVMVNDIVDKLWINSQIYGLK